MMIGAVGALYYRQNNKLFLKITDHKISQTLCWFLILLATINKFHLASVIDNEIISVVAIFLIIGQINVKNRIVNLETSICDYLGKISYGIYVIHPLVIFIFSKTLNRVHIQLPYKYFIVYIVIFNLFKYITQNSTSHNVIFCKAKAMNSFIMTFPRIE